MSEQHVYVPGYGPIGAKIMVLLECPSEEDTSKGKMGFSAKELDRRLREAGINKNECWITGVSKYFVPPSRGQKKIPFAVRAKNHGIDIAEQISDLQNEVNSLKPNLILGIGKSALWATTGKTSIEDYRGSILQGMGRKFVGTYNPEHLNWHATDVEFKGYWNSQIILFDLKRAKKQSEFPEIILPTRNLQICTSSYDLAEFRRMYKAKGLTRMGTDIEAGGHCLPICMGLAFTRHHGITVPLWNVDGISNIPTADLIQCWIILADMLMEFDIVGQNFNYDRDKIRRLGFRIRRLISDVMMKAQAINPELPKGLGFNTSIYTEEPFYKNEGMYQGSIKDLLLGCARDACVTVEVDEAMDPDIDELLQRPYFENFLMKLPEFYLGIENQGFRQHIPTRDSLLRKYIAWDEKIRYELFQLTGAEINVNSHKQIGILLFDNYKLPRRSGTGEEELTALLNNKTNGAKKPEHRRTIELVLEGRRVRKSISTYIMALPDYDGRMRTTYFPCLDTGRSSTGQQDPPIRPEIEVINENGKKVKKSLGTAFQTMTKHGDIGQDVRSMYVPDVIVEDIGVTEGITEDDVEIFLQADSAQAEARVVFLLANDEQALHDIDAHDYHALTASWFFGGTEDDYSKKKLGYESPIRFAGKTLRHAGHLGAGKRRAAISVNTDARKYKIPIQIDESIAERALLIFHSKQPKIQQVFQASVVECLKKNRRLIAPVPYGVRAEYGGTRIFYERWGDELFRQAFSYIPQRAVSDNTKAAGIRIKVRIPEIKIVMESHDALLFSIPKRKLSEWAPIIKEEMERPILFRNCSIPRRPLVIPCELETGNNYQEFKKFKFAVPIEQANIAPVENLVMPPKSITEQFLAPVLPKDSPLDNIIYDHDPGVGWKSALDD